MKWYEKTIEYKYVLEHLVHTGFMPLDGFDEKTADLVTAKGSKFILIEFKKDGSNTCKTAELSKFTQENYRNAYKKLLHLSSHHLIVYGEENNGGELILKYQNYFGYCGFLNDKSQANEFDFFIDEVKDKIGKLRNVKEINYDKYISVVVDGMRNLNVYEYIKNGKLVVDSVVNMLCHNVSSDNYKESFDIIKEGIEKILMVRSNYYYESLICDKSTIFKYGVGFDTLENYIKDFIKFKKSKSNTSSDSIIEELKENIVVVNDSKATIIGLNELVNSYMVNLKNTLHSPSPSPSRGLR